jgi:ubiquinol-cytochrome c reductase cytochrome c subunit
MTWRRAWWLLAVVLAGLAISHLVATATAPGEAPPAGGQPGDVAQGRQLFVLGCASCHGLDARGIRGQGPSLRGVGALSADFYLSTGRMPLADPREPPTRTRPAYSRAEIAALVAYVGSLGGPAVPVVDPAAGSLAAGRQAFTEHCAGCHQELARGGIVIGGVAPALQDATPVQIAEAVRVGPYLMPRFSDRQIDRQAMDDIVRYVRWSRHPDDPGGWGIGHIGPVPEGMVAWLIGLLSLLIVARLIGERSRS